MNILMIGGTGTISQAVTELAVRRGHAVSLLNRGKRDLKFSAPVEQIVADKTDRAGMRAALGSRSFDVVANFIAYTAEDVAADVDLFLGRTGQYMVIS
ncbi:MAG: NAD-dependent epimerase/dehydratase family protein, partial [Planctomycetota bacterium]